ncbi:MAG: outer membrane beta-barrel protein [Bacteroidota bacterium]
MKNFLISLCLLCFFIGNGQNTDRAFEIGLHYPLSTGDNFIVFAYDGVVGLDVNYQVTDFELISPKIGVTIDYFNYNFVDNVNGSAFVFKPRVIGEFNIESLPEFKPYVLLGYSIFSTSINAASAGFSLGTHDPTIQPNGDRFNDTQSGITWGFGAAYDLTETFFVHVTADFIKLNLTGGTSGNRFNENIHTLSMGVGLRF